MAVIPGTTGPDTIDDPAGDDTINADAGDDTIIVDEQGENVVNGGAGNDLLILDWRIADLYFFTEMPTVGASGLTGYFSGGAGFRVDYTGIDRFKIYSGSNGSFSRLGPGNDEAYLGSGQDFVDVGAGINIADGGGGSLDRISADLSAATTDISWDLVANSYSGPGSYSNFEHFDQIKTGSGNDFIRTASGMNEIIDAGAGNDVISVGGGGGADDVIGGFGNDRLIIDWSTSVDSFRPTALLTISPQGGYSGGWTNDHGRYIDFVSIEHFTIMSGSDADHVVTGNGDDLVFAGAGNDFVDVGTGIDQADGGTGTDDLSADMSSATAAFNWNLATNNYSGPVGTSFTNFEYFRLVRLGSGHDVVVTGTLGLRDDLYAGAGDDTITVSNGYDFIYGEGGHDTLIVAYGTATSAIATNLGPYEPGPGSGFSGSYNPFGALGVEFSSIERFLITTGSGNDDISTATGNDVVSTGAGNDRVNVGSGLDQADGGAGVDRIRADMAAITTAIHWNIQTGFYAGPAGTSFTNFEWFEELFTGSGNDIVVTATGAFGEEVVSGLGDDQVTVAGGTDFAYDQGGFDTLIVDYGFATTAVTTPTAPSADATNGGFKGQYGGAATVYYNGFERFLITTGSGADNIVAPGGDDEVRTGTGNDSLNGGAGNDLLDGGTGNDGMAGGLGNDIYIVDSTSDTVTEAAPDGTDTVRTNLGDRAAATVIRYVLPANVENLTGTLGRGQALEDNGLSNVITTSAGADLIVVRNGGNDTVSTGSGNDFLFFGSTFNVLDAIDAGAGRDKLGLHGDYSLTLGPASLTGIEKLVMWTSGVPFIAFSYEITTHNGNVAAGAQLEVTALSLSSIEDLRFDGSAETDGSFWIRSGAGDDILVGGAQADRIMGGMGNDRMVGGGGADRFDVTVLAHSTGINFDTLVGFDATVDRINITGAPVGWATGVSGSLSNTNFDTTLAQLVNGNLEANQAIKVTVTGGDHAGKLFVVFDANGDGSYTSGDDYVFAFQNPVHSNLEGFGFFM